MFDWLVGGLTLLSAVGLRWRAGRLSAYAEEVGKTIALAVYRHVGEGDPAHHALDLVLGFPMAWVGVHGIRLEKRGTRMSGRSNAGLARGKSASGPVTDEARGAAHRHGGTL